MSKVELGKVLNLLIKEEHDAASDMLHEWFVGKSKEILEDLMHNEDEVLEDIDDINKAHDEIEAEKFFGDFDINEDDEDLEGEEAADDLEGSVEGDEVEGEFGAEEGDDAAGEFGGEVEAELTADERIDDLESQLAELNAEFDRLVGATDEEDFGSDADVDGEIEVDTGDDFGSDDSFGVDGDELEEGKTYKFDSEEGDDVDGKKKANNDKRGASKAKRSIEETAEEDEDDQIDEAFELDTVGTVKMDGSKEVGAGGSIKVNTTSPILQKKVEDRAFKGKPVETKGPTHSGFEREKAPALNKAEGAPSKVKNQVAKADDGLKTFKDSESNGSILKQKQAEDKGKSPLAPTPKHK